MNIVSIDRNYQFLHFSRTPDNIIFYFLCIIRKLGNQKEFLHAKKYAIVFNALLKGRDGVKIHWMIANYSTANEVLTSIKLTFFISAKRILYKTFTRTVSKSIYVPLCQKKIVLHLWQTRKIQI